MGRRRLPDAPPKMAEWDTELRKKSIATLRSNGTSPRCPDNLLTVLTRTLMRG